MAVSLPYLVSPKNLPALFDKIASAKVPERFTHGFLKTTIGLKASNDRAYIPYLRTLGFIDQASTPTSAYRSLKGAQRKAAVAEGVKKAYRSLFDSDTKANELAGEKLKSLVAQVAGTDDDITRRIASTFSAIVRLGDFDVELDSATDDVKRESVEKPNEEPEIPVKSKGLRTEFHYNIQIHLPSNGSEEV